MKKVLDTSHWPTRPCVGDEYWMQIKAPRLVKARGWGLRYVAAKQAKFVVVSTSAVFRRVK